MTNMRYVLVTHPLTTSSPNVCERAWSSKSTVPCHGKRQCQVKEVKNLNLVSITWLALCFSEMMNIRYTVLPQVLAFVQRWSSLRCMRNFTLTCLTTNSATPKTKLDASTLAPTMSIKLPTSKNIMDLDLVSSYPTEHLQSL